MSDSTLTEPMGESSPARFNLGLIASGLAGLMAILIAIQTMAYAPGAVLTQQDHAVRLLAFAALTIWMVLALGIKRRGTAAITVLAFASFLELVVLPARGDTFGTLASANLGIVCAYCALQAYSWRLNGRAGLTKPESEQQP